MPIIAKADSGSSFKIMPEGTYFAVCDQVVNLGEQKSSWQGQVRYRHEVWVRWQVASERIQEADGGDSKPMTIGKKYTLSLSEKANLRKDLEAWRGKAFTPAELDGFDVGTILGKGCQISVTHRKTESKTYANVTGVMAIPAGVEAPELEGETLYFDDVKGDTSNLPGWIQEKINPDVPAPASPPVPNSEVVPAAMRGAAGAKPEIPDDDIPF